jgi:heme exporter protein B
MKDEARILRTHTSEACGRAPSYAAVAWAHLRKDLRLEWRTKDSLNGMLFFALLVGVVFAIAFDPTAFPTIARQISGGLLCVAVLFAAMTALNQSWARETQNGVLDAHRLAPSPASALFVGKALANFLFVSAVEVVLAPVFAVFYNLQPLGQAWWLVAILPLGTWCLVVNGTFFAALGLRARNRETLLPLILLPVCLPALLAMIQATTAVLTGEFEPTLWLKVLVGYAVVFTTVCVLLFDTVLGAE